MYRVALIWYVQLAIFVSVIIALYFKIADLPGLNLSPIYELNPQFEPMSNVLQTKILISGTSDEIKDAAI